MSDRPICIAEIMTAHGVRGLVKLRCHLEDPDNLAGYMPVHDDKGKAYTLTLKNPVKQDWVAEVAGIVDRNEAEKLRGLKFYVTRDALPDPDADEVYYEDLIGCAAQLADGTAAGVVIAVENFGAGDLLEIRPVTGQTYYLPLSEPFVQEIDAEARKITIEPAEEFMNE